MAIWSQGLILNSGRSYANLPPNVFRANSGSQLGRIVKIAHSVSNHKYSRRFWLFLQIQNPIF